MLATWDEYVEPMIQLVSADGAFEQGVHRVEQVLMKLLGKQQRLGQLVDDDLLLRTHARILEMQTTAQLTHHAECRLDALKARRAELKAAGSAVSVQDLVLLKVIETLKAHPGLNATLADEVIHHHAAVHLGLAIPLPGDLLVAPALFNAEQLDGEELCQARKALVEKALASKLSVKELTGATFTVSNLGLSRVHHFPPVLNPPQVAILGIGGVQRRLELSASGALVEVEWLGLSLTY